LADPLGDTIMPYGNAEVTGRTLTARGGIQDNQQGALTIGDARVVPSLDKNNNLVGYNVWNTKSSLKHPILQMDAGDLDAFKSNYSTYMSAGITYYNNGEPSDGMKLIGAGILGGDRGMVWKGLKAEHAAAWSDPVFVASFALSVGNAGLGSFRPGPLRRVGGSCFVEGTTVKTKYGEIPIEKLKLGDTVWAYNERLAIPTLQTVELLIVNKVASLRRLDLGGEVIWGTEDHPFWIDSKWVALRDIKVGDSVLLITGQRRVVTGVAKKDTAATVYNITVSSDHSYYISSYGVLVHNDCYLPTTKVSAIKLVHPESTIITKVGYKAIQALSNEELIRSVTRPANGDYIRINPSSGRAFDGNTRIYELQRRGLNDVVVPYRPYSPDNSMFYDM